jgi:hypothetical protein
VAPLPLSRVVFFIFFFAAAVFDGRVPSVAAAFDGRVPSVSAVFAGRVFSLLAPLAGGGEAATDPSASDSASADIPALTPPLPVLKQRPNIVDANVDIGTGEWLPCSTKRILFQRHRLARLDLHERDTIG